MGIVSSVPTETLDWLLEDDTPAVAAMTRRELLGESARDIAGLWSRRNEYAPVAAILAAMNDDGSWAAPERDYQKYGGSLWQIHFLGELWADGSDERVRRAADYAFSRQMPDGSWSSNGRASASAPCLTANVARALARLGYAQDERVVRALAYCADLFAELGVPACRGQRDFALSGYCHMLTPKILLFLSEVPEGLWPDGAQEMRDACIRALAQREVHRCLPVEYKEFRETVLPRPKAEMAAAREAFIAEHAPIEYGDKPGWLRFGYPLSYNSDALEALWSLVAIGEPWRPEFGAARDAVRAAADEHMRWTLRNSFNGKMLADVEAKGKPSKWLTLRALRALGAYGD